METETNNPGMEAHVYDESDSEEPEPKPPTDVSKGSEPGDQTDSASEAEMEIQIGAVFSLASDDINKQNETIESEPNEAATTSFSDSTVSTVEDDAFNKSDGRSVTHEEYDTENIMNAENTFENGASSSDNSAMNVDNVRVDSPQPLSSLVKANRDASGKTCLNKTTTDSVSRQPRKHSDKTTKKPLICYEDKDIVPGKKFSYCYVKLFDVLNHRVVKQEVINMEKKSEIDNEVRSQEMDQSQKTQPKKKMKKKPPRLTIKKKKKAKKNIEEKEIPKPQEKESTISKRETPNEAAATKSTSLPDSTPGALPVRPSRKRKFNRNLFTDSVFFDIRGISNFEDHVVQKQEEEEVKCRTAPTYRIRGSRPQVARTKKKLNRIQREDMPFISVTLDSEKIEKIEKTKLAYSKEKVTRPISYLLDRKVRLYHSLLKTHNGSFRILKNNSKSSYLKRAEKAMKKAKRKSDSKKADISNSKEKEINVWVKKDEQLTMVSPTNWQVPPHLPMLHDREKLDIRAVLSSKKPKVTDPDSLVLPVKVEPGTTTYDWNKATPVSEQASISLTGRYRKPSNKYSSFITDFERRNWSVPPKILGKTTVKSEPQPYVEMDIAADAEAIVRKQQEGKKYCLSNHDKTTPSERNPGKLSTSPTTGVEGLSSSSQNNVSAEQSAIKTHLSNLKSIQPKVTLNVEPPSKNRICEQSNLFKSTVNELAKVQNTKKFYQLRIGDKMVLIPADGGDMAPKAYVIDVASNPLLTPPSTVNTSNIPGVCSTKSLGSSPNWVGSKSPVNSIGIKCESNVHQPTQASNNGSVFANSSSSATATKASNEDISTKLSFDTENVKRTHSSPPMLSPQIQLPGSIEANSKQIPPVLSPETSRPETVGCVNAEPPVLSQEVASCGGDSPNHNKMKSILSNLSRGNSPGEVSSSSCPGLPTSAERPQPKLTLIGDGRHNETVVVKKEPAHLRNFEGGESTKESLPNITTQGSRSLYNDDNHKDIPSLDSRFPPNSGFALSFNRNDMENSSSKVDLMPPILNHNTPNSSRLSDNIDKSSSVYHSVASIGSNQDTIRSNKETKDDDKDIKTVTHVPANETMVQQRIRQLRERLRETQANLDNIKKTNRIKKENMEDGYNT
ncbi:LOW QUALITY PROTEIN: uncharacterized protein [Argopecten irradians]|uniref:LOW QUALITY PROTEIN: uncharacterized protein n=1 Tax=Argopecten irradians TaxID=31199 RepID=UPI00372296C7